MKLALIHLGTDSSHLTSLFGPYIMSHVNSNLAYLLVGVLVVGGFYLTLNSGMPAVGSASASSASAQAQGAGSSPGEAAPLSAVAARLDKHLFVVGDDGDVHGFAGSKLAGVKYFAFYYSASWCPPCRAFTPDLVQFYHEFKPAHPDFELIFVGQDQSDGDMVNYMKGDSMPWPAVWYQDNETPSVQARKYLGPGIPCLVLVDADGNVLSDSFSGSQYLGPQHVIDDIKSMVP